MGREETSRHLSDHQPRGLKVEQPDLWCVGFVLDSLALCRWLTGLVELHYVEVRIIDGQPVVFFYVTSKDRSGILFQEGMLTGQRIDSFYKDLQAKYIQLERHSLQSHT